MNDVTAARIAKTLPGPIDQVPITFIGHPWAPIGMGEQLRSHLAAAAAVHLDFGVYDIFRYAARHDPAHDAVIGASEIDRVPAGIRIFHINGDEVERVLEAFAARGNDFADGINIIVPAWELPVYPQLWAEQLRRFDGVWALSRFIQDGLSASGVESRLVGQSVQPYPGPLLPRRHFGIRESAFVLLNFFDLTSYTTRKNPEAVTALYDRLRAAEPFRDIQLVLKAKSGEQGAEAWAESFARAHPRIHMITTPLDTEGVRGLIASCDCFVSLHRAEGFGRGLGEAMALGRLALGTGWSGNTDFMTPDNALVVRHHMRALGEGDYPHWQGQSWAEPEVDHAASLVSDILANPAKGRAIARRGQASVLQSHSNRAVGLRMLDAIQELLR